MIYIFIYQIGQMANEQGEKTCCCGCCNLDKGIMIIAVLTFFELCGTFSNFGTTWFVFLLKLITVGFFVFAFCNFESSRIRKFLYIIYLSFAILEGLLILLWCAVRVGSNAANFDCAERI